jgi:hypothetical protein
MRVFRGKDFIPVCYVKNPELKAALALCAAMALIRLMVLMVMD